MAKDEKIIIDASEPLDKIIDEAEAILAKDASVYQMMGEIVYIHKDQDATTFRSLKPGYARYLLSKVVQFQKPTIRNGEIEFINVHPPAAVARGIVDKPANDKIKPLKAVVSFPPISAEGHIRTEEGYDEITQTYYTGGVKLNIADKPSLTNAKNAIVQLYDVVEQFPFQDEVHKAAFLCALLTPIVRWAHNGNMPMVVFSASGPRCGKTRLAKIINYIVNGNDLAVLPYTKNEEEERKRVLGFLKTARSLILIDNVEGVLGGFVLNALATTRVWEDRSLGHQKIIRANNFSVFVATGNNIILASDLSERSIYCRLQTDEENPHLRDNFKYPNILEHVAQHRDELLSAAITIIKAYIDAGKPKQNIQQQGSFEEHGALVRGALVWCGLPDPALTRKQLEKTGDVNKYVATALVDGWLDLCCEAGGDAIEYGMTAREATLKLSNGAKAPILRDVLVELTKSKTLPTSHSLGRFLMSVRDRNYDDKILRVEPDAKHGHRYKVYPCKGD